MSCKIDLSFFKEKIIPLLKEYEVTYMSFPNGDFGKLEQIRIEGRIKLASVDIWSEGWLGLDIYDIKKNDQVMNVLLSPENPNNWDELMSKFVGKLLSDE